MYNTLFETNYAPKILVKHFGQLLPLSKIMLK